MKPILKTAFFVATLAISAPSAPTAETALTKAEINTLIETYLLNNGEVIAESLVRYQTQQQTRRASALIGPETPIKGDKNAPITLIEFSDFECPYCQKVQTTTKELERRYGKRIKFAFKHSPLDFHKKGEPAALAAIAAQNQGKFWEYAEQLFARQSFLGEKLYIAIAKDLNLNMKQFNADRKSKKAKNHLTKDKQDAARIGVRGTPFFLINGQTLSGAQPLDNFVTVIEDALKQTKK